MSQTSDMNAITARAIFSIYPHHMNKKISFPNSLLGDSTSAAWDMNERQQIRELGSNRCMKIPCNSDCPATARVTTDLVGFGQFVYCPYRGPPMPNSQYMWLRESVCFNTRCDNYATIRDSPVMPNAPNDLYLLKDINGKSSNRENFLG